MNSARIVSVLILSVGLIAVAAWMTDQVGGAGFWYNFRGWALAFLAYAAMGAGVVCFVWLVCVAIEGDWGVWA